MSPSLPPRFLSHAELDTVIRRAPLIAIDLIIRDARDEVLLGLRKNEPAKGCFVWFPAAWSSRARGWRMPFALGW